MNKQNNIISFFSPPVLQNSNILLTRVPIPLHYYILHIILLSSAVVFLNCSNIIRFLQFSIIYSLKTSNTTTVQIALFGNTAPNKLEKAYKYMKIVYAMQYKVSKHYRLTRTYYKNILFVENATRAGAGQRMLFL